MSGDFKTLFTDPQDPLEDPSVLLVDDDLVTRMVTAVALRAHGFSVEEVDGGLEALDFLQRRRPDLLLLDANMPGLDGFATCEKVRALPSCTDLPILMLTGLEDEDSVVRAYRVGATDFFTKSNLWHLLAGRLRYLLRSSRTNRELIRSRQRLARAHELARMGSFEWLQDFYDTPYRLGQLNLSEEVERALQVAVSNLSVRQVLRMVAPNERHRLLRAFQDLVRSRDDLACDVTINLPKGRRRVVHLELEFEREEGSSQRFAGILQDVTERHQAEERIRQLANFDTLTGLPNRHQIMWRAERALEHAQRHAKFAAMLLIDLDRFKIVNDTLGHAAGDELLMEVGRRLRRCVRHNEQVLDGFHDSGTIRNHRALEAVGRLGGDEFVALLPEVTSDRDPQRVAERILQALRDPITVAGQEFLVTASVGVAVYPRDGDNVADLLRNADMAMYAAKDSGRNSAAVYQPQLSANGLENIQLEAALRRALERGELELHYQPKVDPKRHQMHGVEALMRWRRNGHLVSPGEFIPLAEETGLIMPMTEWAIDEAARQAAAWRTEWGFDGSVAVNIPSRFASTVDLKELVLKVAERHGVSPQALQLEITESSLMKDLELVQPRLMDVHCMGLGVSIDDFGTGYSSLAYLTRLPLSELKIDASFVRVLDSNPQSNAVVASIIALGGALGLGVVAEGVETDDQRRRLDQMGCPFMQGYLFSRPLLPDDLSRWAKDWFKPVAAPVEARRA